MDIALCYESVLPARGGAETYIGDLARRLARDGHAIHLYASRWDAAALPAATHFHRLDVPSGPRFLRPWRFGAACERALRHNCSRCQHRLRQDMGAGRSLSAGGAARGQRRAQPAQVRSPDTRAVAPNSASGSTRPHGRSRRLERKQYLGPGRHLVVVNSRMVQRHFEQYYGVAPESVRVVRSAIDPLRFAADDRLKRRHDERSAGAFRRTKRSACSLR